MVLKDWKLVKVKGYDYSWKNVKIKGWGISIKSNYVYILEPSYSVFFLNKKLKTKTQALKYAKEYMKKFKENKPIKEYDKKGNLIYYKDSDGFEEWRKYNKNNKLIHYKNSKGFEEWRKYNKNNKLIHYKNSKGEER